MCPPSSRPTATLQCGNDIVTMPQDNSYTKHEVPQKLRRTESSSKCIVDDPQIPNPQLYFDPSWTPQSLTRVLSHNDNLEYVPETINDTVTSQSNTTGRRELIRGTQLQEGDNLCSDWTN